MKTHIFLAILLSGCAQQVGSNFDKDLQIQGGQVSADQVVLVEQNKSVYKPAAFFSVAQYYYKNDQLDHAAKYFLLGFIRTNLDAMGCYDDRSALDGAVYNSLSAFFAGLGVPNQKKELMFHKKAQAKIDQAFQENEKIPYDYNRLWPYSVGMKMFVNPNGQFRFADEKMQRDNVSKVKEDVKKSITYWINKLSKPGKS